MTNIDISEENKDKFYQYILDACPKKSDKNYNDAIEDYTKAIEINPSNALGYRERGRAKEKLEDYQGAIDDYTKAIEIRDDDFYHENYTDTKQVLEEYHYQLSTVKKQLKDNKGADKDN